MNVTVFNFMERYYDQGVAPIYISMLFYDYRKISITFINIYIKQKGILTNSWKQKKRKENIYSKTFDVCA